MVRQLQEVDVHIPNIPIPRSSDGQVGSYISRTYEILTVIIVLGYTDAQFR